MNLSKADIEFLLTLKKSFINTNKGNIYKYLSGPFSVNSNYVIEGPDNSFSQLTNPGGSTLKLGNEYIKTSSSLDANLLLRINKTIDSSNYVLYLSFDDLLNYKNISVEFFFKNIRSTLHIYLPLFIDGRGKITQKGIQFFSFYRQKFQINSIPINYLLNHISIKTNLENSNIVIHRHDGETTSEVEKGNLYFVYNSTLDKLFTETNVSKSPIRYLLESPIVPGEKVQVAENIELTKLVTPNLLGCFFVKNYYNVVAFNQLVSDSKNLYGVILGDLDSLLEKFKLLLVNSIYPYGLFVLYNGAYCVTFTKEEDRNKVQSMFIKEPYIPKINPVRGILYTFHIKGCCTNEPTQNYHFINQIISKLKIINLTMNNENIWITIEENSLEECTRIIESYNVEYTRRHTTVHSSYIHKVIKDYLEEITGNCRNYVFSGTSKELISDLDNFEHNINESIESLFVVKPKQIKALSNTPSNPNRIFINPRK